MGRLSIFLVFLVVYMFSTSMGFNYTCHEIERNALLKLRSGLLDADVRDSWIGNDCCKWKGVACDNSTHHIIKMFLSGGIVDPVQFLQAIEVNSPLLELKYLTYLDLSSNYFFSSSFLKFIGSMRQLRYLDLSNSYFDGKIPHQLGNLTNLVFLDLKFACRDCEIEKNSLGWISKLKNLQYLNLDGMNLENALDGLDILSHLPSLKSLSLSHCRLSNSHLVIRNLTISSSRLEHLDLSSNQFSGSIPPFIQSLSYIKFLNLSFNNLNCSFPITKSMLPLRVLDISHNRFEIIPSSFQELLYLESMVMSYNHLRVVSQVNLDNFSNLKALDMSSNPLTLDLSSDWEPPFQLKHLYIQHSKLNTPFPKWILTQKRILRLDLSDTGVFGPLKEDIGNSMPSLQILHLANNQINGSVPRSLCGIRSLQVLDLQKNRFSGVIPDCWMDSQLVGLELSSNILSGPIPNSLMQNENLQVLSLSKNLLHGMLPLFMSSSLMLLDVGENNFYGEIPPWNESCIPVLQILILRRNNIKGVIPFQLCSIGSLQIIDLASNNLSGNIPECFGHFEGMGYTQELSPGPSSSVVETPGFDTKDWSAIQVIKGETLEYTTVLHMLVNMDLSCNNLVGEIPTSITNLILLRGLNLSYNHLTSTIPRELGNMQSMESLDLSHNNLSGSVPESISSIYSLNKMNLSFNNLQGQIPTGSQLQTLEDPSSIYMGNPDLCGDPLPSCFNDNISSPPTSMVNIDEKENKHEKIWFYLVIMLGFASGFWGVIGTLVVKRTWRHTYFQLAEEFGEWIYVKATIMIARAKEGK